MVVNDEAREARGDIFTQLVNCQLKMEGERREREEYCIVIVERKS